MKHRIDPKVDCVFKALLGAEENRNLLVHFLNAILATELHAAITSVDILNPYNEREFLDDKLSIVDVKARDADGKVYQIEIQLAVYSSLPGRILYNWADVYSQQLQSGNGYHLLRPTYAIWLLAENLLLDDPDYVHAYKLRNNNGRILTDHGGIWLLELEKFTALEIETEQQRWLQFFKYAGQFDDPATVPKWMETAEMRQAMNTLRQFSEKERNYHAYQARQNYLRQQSAIQGELAEARQERLEALREKEAALQRERQIMQEKEAVLQRERQTMQEKEAALQRERQTMQEKEAALLEVERLKAMLAAKM